MPSDSRRWNALGKDEQHGANPVKGGGAGYPLPDGVTDMDAP